ncbi:hypothetical protein MUK42_34436 [Musa troglodytarum]|uniref:Uncharacterized protein n=1 Tax=Musa troglodytarum TaxID=320322 RepID=A0A9E7HSA8_9LILI|nr:hypothetical protein MUK42_34436 [Musa troglodytarum]
MHHAFVGRPASAEVSATPSRTRLRGTDGRSFQPPVSKPAQEPQSFSLRLSFFVTFSFHRIRRCKLRPFLEPTVHPTMQVVVDTSGTPI